MNRKYYKSVIGEIKLIGVNTEGLPMWSINHYIDSFCNNYNKILIVRRICELIQQGAYDNQFIIAKKSADLFPTKLVKDSFNWESDRYIVLSSKGEEPKEFWHIIKSYVRPMVFYKEGSDILPLIDYNDDDAIKVTSMKYNSPVQINLKGATGALLDLINEPNRREMEDERHVSELLNNSIKNINDIASASQTINDVRTPDGVKHYANATLNDLIRIQDKLNKKLGIRADKIDLKC